MELTKAALNASVSIQTADQVGVVALSLMLALAYIGSVPLAAIAPSLLADISDYSRWKSGADRTATYFSLYTFALKASLAVGGSIGLGIGGWYGFSPASTVHSESAIFGLQLSASWLPATFMLLSIFVIQLTPINEHQHQIVRRRLDRKLSLEDAAIS